MYPQYSPLRLSQWTHTVERFGKVQANNMNIHMIQADFFIQQVLGAWIHVSRQVDTWIEHDFP